MDLYIEILDFLKVDEKYIKMEGNISKLKKSQSKLPLNGSEKWERGWEGKEKKKKEEERCGEKPLRKFSNGNFWRGTSLALSFSSSFASSLSLSLVRCKFFHHTTSSVIILYQVITHQKCLPRSHSKTHTFQDSCLSFFSPSPFSFPLSFHLTHISHRSGSYSMNQKSVPVSFARFLLSSFLFMLQWLLLDLWVNCMQKLG